MHVRGLPWLLLTLLLAGPLAAGTPKRVSWLNSIQQPPDEIPGDKLRFLSVRQANLDQLIESRKDWEAHREIVRDRWLTYLGESGRFQRSRSSRLKRWTMASFASGLPTRFCQVK